MKIYIAIDNGVTGSVGILSADDYITKYLHTPIKKELSYTKKKQWINRIDGEALFSLLNQYPDAKVFLERPLVNPGMFKATISAIRALEATLIIIERLKMPYQYVDSKQWQSAILPSGLQGSAELKKASLQIGKRMFPQLNFTGFKDADGILMAAWAKNNKN